MIDVSLPTAGPDAAWRPAAPPPPRAAPPADASRGPRLAVAALAVGALAVVLAATPFKTFELDRFFVPKELALHVAAALAAAAALGGARRLVVDRVDAALLLFLALSAASAALAPNPWLAARALGVSLSAAAVFWAARAAGRAGLARPLVAVLAVAAAVGAATALLQTYGARSAYFSINRAPGGTFGNRNFVAHLAATGVPLAALWAQGARRGRGFVVAAAASALLAAVLVLTRSRAAWLAVAAGAAPLLLGAWRARRLAPADRRLARRRRALVGAIGAAALLALAVPNALNWKSSSPYLDTVRGVVNYREGSGRGRLLQYGNSLRMALAHPLLGVGPGNWGVRYPRYARPRDPSLASDGMTANPWPSSDWVAFVAERGAAGPRGRGAAATLALAAALGMLGLAALRAVRRGAEAVTQAASLGGALLAALVAGAFDASLLLAAPALVVWAALGALAGGLESRGAAGRGGALPAAGGARVVPLGPPARRRLQLAVLAVGAALAARGGAQLLAMAAFDGAASPAALARAAALDPGSYRVRLRLAEAYRREGSCARARAEAAAAGALFPEAAAPRRVLAACRGRG